MTVKKQGDYYVGTPTDVIEALKGWYAEQPPLKDHLRELGLLHPEWKDELRQLLDETKEFIFGSIAKTLASDRYKSKIFLSEITHPSLKAFLQKIYVDRGVRDIFRGFFRQFFGDHIRVEGGPDDLYLEIDSGESEEIDPADDATRTATWLGG